MKKMDNKNNKKLSHISAEGSAKMVDVSGKAVTARRAVAEAWVEIGESIAATITEAGGLAKGNVLETARLAGILAAKRTAELIPMCHPLPLNNIEVSAEIVGPRVRILAQACCDGKTGVEMEAMTAASIAALTVYDMVKSAGKGVTIGPIQLMEKSGGKSGQWKREEKHG